jgi:lincosamide and streptogramin A transport system ATP-binding/permease protein
MVALFLAPDSYPLIDEPTNHLDARGRAAVTAYLARQSGFLVVSHDRRFLDEAVDHVLSINANDIRVNQGNFSQWRAHMDEELAFQQRTRRRIERDVARLQVAARETRQHADSRESDKYRTGAMDKGFIGHRAAKKMRRARSVERRIETELEQKRGLLANQEKQRSLKVVTAARRHDRLIAVQNLAVSRGDRTLFRDVSFAVAPGDRIAVVGANGSGKTTLLDAICGTVIPDAGMIHVPGHVTLARGHQHPPWRSGRLSERLQEAGLEETRFRQLLGVLGVGAEACESDLAACSPGELKKLDLCRCLMSGADVLLLDEPLNYVDLYSREQIEASLLEDRPTLVFVEHDRVFVERIATRVIDLGP